MPVDIPSLYTQAGSLKRPATGTAPTGGTLPLTPGEQARAQVLKSTPLSAALGAKLLSAGTESGQSPSANGDTAESARSALLTTYRSAMARNEMHLAALLIRGKSVTTVVDQPLQKGQFLNVQMTQQGKLMALNAKFDAPPLAQPASPQSTALIAALKPVLRELLPRQGQQDLLSQLQRLPNVSPSVTQVGGDKSLGKLLGQIDQIALNLNAPASGKAVRTALEQSGTLLEPRLMRAIRSPAPDTAVKDVLAKDLKAALLQYLAPLRPAGANPAPVGAPTPAPSTPAASQPVTGELALPSLMQMLSSHSQSSGGESLRMLQTQLVLLMHQLSLNTLARVRLNQLQPEARSARGAEPAQAPLNFDIPVRLDGHLYPAHIEIEERADKDHEAEASAETVRVWQVNLTLEPPGIGEFFVRLRLRADQLSVAFWSEQPRALAKAESAFTDIRNTLAKHDIDVRDVQFHQGVPPHKGNQLSYHLVDIKT
ncbi:flagellar hook-length control protein FliK [Gilvimarinus agarilyticus]|uniref:flagellar hook-length control protein FliK n=1 Tax=Gilvimarinus agarilyticus TaxID=679259 RepID=UPI0005A0FFB8|nr:flagellar hook-length control protein FliK [Gilvimarinus agarilyticus]